MEYKLEDFIKLSEQKKEIRFKKEIVDGVNVGIFSYMVEMPNTFKTEIARECRGITFNLDTKELISLPFPKFFNVNQCSGWMEKDIDWNNITYIGEKFDGSMAVPVSINHKIFWKTKKSFYSDVAVKIQNYWNSGFTNSIGRRNKGTLICLLHACGYTPIFEYVAPTNKIVIDYEKEELIDLNARGHKDGNHYTFPYNIIEDVKKEVDINNSKKFIEYVSKLEGKEGFVCWDDTNKMFFKLKSKWYFDLHKLYSEISVRNIIDLILDEKIDDLVGELKLNSVDNKVSKINKLWSEISEYKLNLIIKAENAFEQLKKEKRTLFANYVLQDYKEISSILFNMKDNKDYNESLNKMCRNRFKEKYKGKII